MSVSDKPSVWKKYGQLFRTYAQGEKKCLYTGVMFGVVAAVLAGAGIPLIIQSVFPIVFGSKPLPEPLATWANAHISPENLPSFTMWAAAVFIPLVIMARGAATFFNTYLLTKSGLRILERLRLSIFKRLQELPLAFHERHKRGELLNHVLNNTALLQGNMIMIMNDLVIQPLTLISALAYLVYTALQNAEAAMLLINLIITGACIPIIKKVGNNMVKKTRQIVDIYGNMTAIVEENLTAQREIRAFNLEERQVGMLQKRIRDYISFSVKLSVWSQSLAPAIEIVSAVALAFSLYMGCRDGLTLEQFTAIATAFYYCYAPIKTLGNIQNTVRITEAVFDKISEILYAPDEMPEPENPTSLPCARGDISFRDVSFAYVPDTPVLKNINVEIPAGQIVALVGPSGSGKTTFINLICRFYDVRKGSICLDGIDVRNISKKDRTKAIGLVSQFPVLFKGSIEENILIGRPDATKEEVREAAQSACVSEFAEASPEGYNRQIADGGEGLSGGQKQRISIARAFLKNAPVLILDEATASLDMNSEEQIQQSLNTLSEGHTTFIIAHRFSTIRMAHRILVFESGRIIGDGTHEELYESSPLYRDLYDRQSASLEKGGEQ